MLFVLDVGNTNTVLGVFKGDCLQHEWRIKTDRHRTEDEMAVLVKALFDHKGISFADINGIIISSVVPPLMLALEKMCTQYFNLKPLIIGDEDVDPCLNIRYPNTAEIGADRIVNAVGAIKKYGAPLIIIDFGTATTYCYINEDAEYEGGLIAPGISISMDALYRTTAKLPKIEIQAPQRVIGSSTVEAMQSGIFHGYVGQVDGIVRRIKQETNQNPKVIATGGLASLIADASKTIDHVEPHLTLNGLYYIYHKNNGEGDC
ncbi:MAG TPA: type III pantothenate kinase [Bacillota bacterium]|nr:type III pantothenate kinase [Bacillota bacterium]